MLNTATSAESSKGISKLPTFVWPATVISLYLFPAFVILFSNFLIANDYHAMLILNIFTFIACLLGSVKSIMRLHIYIKQISHSEQTLSSIKSHYFTTLDDKSHYIKYRITFFLISLLFYGGCFIANIIFDFPAAALISLTYVLFAVDVFFFTKRCLLNDIINLLFNTPLRCCVNCPTRGWDLVMLALPCTFALLKTEIMPFNKICIILFAVLAFASLAGWEITKFGALSAKRNCAFCKQVMGTEYMYKRACLKKSGAGQ